MKQALLRIFLILIAVVFMFTFTGCKYFTKPSGTSDVDMTSEIRNTIENFFSDNEYESAYIIVDNYADLCEVYECANIKPASSSIISIQGNAHDANIKNIYSEDYFKSGYVIAVLTKDSSGSWSFECSATKNGDKVIVKLVGTIPGVSTNDIGGFLYLVSIDGVYANESVILEKTYNTRESHPADETTSSVETTTL